MKSSKALSQLTSFDVPYIQDMESIQLSEFRANVYQELGVNACPVYGGDGIMREIFRNIGFAQKRPFVVEFGEERSLGTTTRLLRVDYLADTVYFSTSLGLRSRILNVADVFWASVRLKKPQFLRFLKNMPYQFHASEENIVQHLSHRRIATIDLMVIDIDSIDFYLTKRILMASIRPRVFVVEFNPSLPTDEIWFLKRTTPKHSKISKRAYGASVASWNALFTEFEYDLVYVEGFTYLYYVDKRIVHPFRPAEIEIEITTTQDSIQVFLDTWCLPEFVPSWLREADLSEHDLQSYFENSYVPGRESPPSTTDI